MLRKRNPEWGPSDLYPAASCVAPPGFFDQTRRPLLVVFVASVSARLSNIEPIEPFRGYPMHQSARAMRARPLFTAEATPEEAASDLQKQGSGRLFWFIFALVVPAFWLAVLA